MDHQHRCEHCGRLYFAFASYRKEQKFCSPEHQRDAHAARRHRAIAVYRYMEKHAPKSLERILAKVSL